MRPPSARPEERVYRRHAADVYRFALALLLSPREAEHVTRSICAYADRLFAAGERPSDVRSWMIDVAHAWCRARSASEEPDAVGAHETAACGEAAALSREADGVLSRSGARELRDHVGRCPDCDGWARSLYRQRLAFRKLALEPVPGGLLD